MISIYDLSLDFDEHFTFEVNSTTGKISDNDIAVCFYNSKRTLPLIKTIGGKKNSSYGVKTATVLLRYTDNSYQAELKAAEIQNYFDERKCRINGKNVYFTLVYNEPIFLGTDDTGIYEYSYELNIYYER